MTTFFVKRQMIRAQQVHEGVNGTSFTTADGRSLVGVFTENPRLDMADAGYEDRDTAVLVCSSPQFHGSIPQHNELVTVRGRQWRISNKPHEGPGSVKLELVAL
jgi:hypothetical protein